MSVSFHKGLSAEFRKRIRHAGISMDETGAQRFLAGSGRIQGAGRDWIEGVARSVLDSSKRFELMRTWEGEHPGQKPFPPLLPEEILNILETADEDDLTSAIARIRTLCETDIEE